MRVEVIRGTDLERERWNFILYADYSGDRIYFSDYHKEARPTKRHNWKFQQYWERIGSRTSVKTPPPIPPDVEQEARAQLIEQLMKTPITT
jgi:hypothetical protein